MASYCMPSPRRLWGKFRLRVDPIPRLNARPGYPALLACSHSGLFNRHAEVYAPTTGAQHVKEGTKRLEKHVCSGVGRESLSSPDFRGLLRSPRKRIRRRVRGVLSIFLDVSDRADPDCLYPVFHMRNVGHTPNLAVEQSPTKAKQA